MLFGSSLTASAVQEVDEAAPDLVRLTIDSTDLGVVLIAIGEFTSRSFVLGPGLEASVTGEFRFEDAAEALNTILEAHSLALLHRCCRGGCELGARVG